MKDYDDVEPAILDRLSRELTTDQLARAISEITEYEMFGHDPRSLLARLNDIVVPTRATLPETGSALFSQIMRWWQGLGWRTSLTGWTTDVDVYCRSGLPRKREIKGVGWWLKRDQANHSDILALYKRTVRSAPLPGTTGIHHILKPNEVIAGYRLRPARLGRKA